MSDAETGVDGSADTPMTRESVEALWSLIEDLESTVTDQRERIDELESDVRTDHAGLSNRIDELEAQLDELAADVGSLTAIAAGGRSTRLQRAIALARKLQTVTRTRASPGDPARVSWTYSDVQDQLESAGLGQVHPPQAYTAMDDVADACDGVEVRENHGGTTVVRAYSDRLNGERPVNEIKNAGPEDPGQTDPDNTTTVGDN